MKLYTAKVVAKWLGMTERNVRQLTKKKILTEYKDGLYQLPQVTTEYVNFLRNKNPNTEEDVDYNEERALLVRTKRENAELELQLKKNDLHQSEEVEQLMTDMLIRFKTKLMAIPAKQSPVLAKKSNKADVFKILKKAIDEALEELADYDKTFGGEDNAEEHN